MSEKIKDHDDQIIELLKADDQEGCKLLFQNYYVYLFKIVILYVKNTDDTADVLQDLFLAIWTKRHTITLHKPLDNYLAKSAINRARNHLRGKGRAIEKTADITEHGFEPVAPHSPESDLYVNDIKILYREALSRMSPDVKAIYLMSRKNGMTYVQIAKHLGISTKTVERRMADALKILEDVFKDTPKALLLILTLTMH